jgi:hypothetical protein
VKFLPAGLAAEAPCVTADEDKSKVTTCRWRGRDGQVEIRLVRGSKIGSPEDLIPSAGVPRPTKVRGLRALTLDRPGAGSLVVWMDRPGVGVSVTAEGAARDHLMRIAEGVRP